MELQDITDKTLVLGESDLQLRVISHCKQEMVKTKASILKEILIPVSVSVRLAALSSPYLQPWLGPVD